MAGNMRIMGVDLGTKNIGIALSDETCTIAQGKEIILRVSDKKAIARIKEIAGEFQVKEIVVGLPVNMNGTLGRSAEDARRFALKLEEETGLDVSLWDERLSTKEAESVMREALMTRKKRKSVLDKLAAQLILQGYLDSLKA